MARALVALAIGSAVVVSAATDSEAVATVCYLGVLVGAGVGAWVGAARAPRGQRLVPWLIAGGVSLTALGDVLWSVLDLAGAETDVSVADVPWFVSYVLLCAALWVVLGRGRAGGGGRLDIDFVIDVLTLGAVTGLVFWSLSIEAIVADDSVSAPVRAVWAAYPIADAVLLALGLRVLMSPRYRTRIGTSFAVGVALWLAADVAYSQGMVGHAALVAMDACWMVAPVLVARAAWRVDDGRPPSAGPPIGGGPVTQLVIAIGPLLVPPALEITADLRGEPDQPLLFLTGTATLIALAVVRTARLLRREDRARLELEEARDAALEASRAKSMFLANMSHEIRTPLTTVLATAEMLEDTSLTALQASMLGRMHRSGERLKTLVEDILDFSRIEAGQIAPGRSAFDLRALTADLADVYGPRAAEAGVGFGWCVDENVPPLVVGDAGRLFQVVANLLDNALKFTPEGRVDLSIRCAADGAARVGSRAATWVDLTVHDTGIGIAAADLRSVFESFRQVDGSTTRRYGGSGLGLAICRELTTLMGGTITVRSEVGVGTAFVVRLPLDRSVVGDAVRTTSG